jgi:broad specificity phosphatase PhoE
MKVFLVRHAESVLNAKNTGQYPHTELSSNGLRQAERLAERLTNVKTDLLLCSRYKRAMQTAQTIGKRIGRRVTYTTLLNEWKRPTEMQGQNVDGLLSKKITAAMLKHIDDPSWHYSDEENFFDLKKRMVRFLKYLQKSRKKTAIVVTHGYTIRMLIAIMLFGEDMDMKSFYKFASFIHTTNTGITECAFENGKWRLYRLNDYAHTISE